MEQGTRGRTPVPGVDHVAVMGGFRIDIVEREGTLAIVVAGELDIATAPALEDALSRAKATDARSILVDLEQLEFIDSSGLAVLLKHTCGDDNRGRIRLTTGSRQAQRLFEISGTLHLLPFVSPD